MSVYVLPFGKAEDGTEVFRYVLSSPSMQASLTDLGACIVSLEVPGAQGTLTDIALGFSDAEGYTINAPNFGAVVGRVANRIAGASFELNGKQYKLKPNDGKNLLHSGDDAWKKRVWQAEVHEDGVTFSLESPENDQGFPGKVTVRVTYTLTPDNSLVLTYDAESSERTPLNLTNHSYFNLNGHASGSMLDHTLLIAADEWLPVDAENIPTGEIVRVGRTPMDFREMWRVRDGIETKFPALAQVNGYDHCYVLDDDQRPETAFAARIEGDQSNIAMDVYTDLPGIQFYTGNFLNGEVGKGGVKYHIHTGFCLETEFFPDAVNHPEWAQCIVDPGHPFHSTTVYHFSVAEH